MADIVDRRAGIADAIQLLPSTIVDGRGDVGCPVVHFDFTVAAEAGSYHELAKVLRDWSPTYFNTLAQGFWMVTTYDAVRDMFERQDLFSSTSFVATDPDPAFRMLPTQVDAPDHLKYRRILNPWFSAATIKRREHEIRAIARRLVEEIVETGGCDVVSRFCMRLPTEVYLLFVGQPTQDADLMVPWVEAFFDGYTGAPDTVEPMQAALESLHEYYRQILADRAANMRDPSTDFFSNLLTAKFDDRLLDADELQDICFELTTASLDTTRAHMGYLLWHLAQHDDDRQRLNEDMSLVPKAVEESLRYHAIVFGDGRKAIKDEEFYGCNLKQGDMMFGVIASANRDPSRFADPDKFIIDRPGAATHLGFATGPHKCLGLHLARRDLQIGLEEWHRLIPDYELDTREPLLERGSQLSLMSLPLRWRHR